MDTLNFLIPSLNSIIYINKESRLWFLDPDIFKEIEKYQQRFAQYEKTDDNESSLKRAALYRTDCFDLYHEVIQTKLVPQLNEFINFLINSKLDLQSSPFIYKLTESRNFFDTSIYSPKQILFTDDQFEPKDTILHAILFDEQLKKSQTSFLSKIDKDSFPNVYSRISVQTAQSQTFFSLLPYSSLQPLKFLYEIIFYLNKILSDMMINIDRTESLFMPDLRNLGSFNTDIIIDT